MADKKYSDFAAGVPASTDVILFADPSTGLLEKVTIPDFMNVRDNVTTNRQTASYTLVLADAFKLVEINVASANNLTVPANATVAFPTGTQILIAQYGAGQTSVVPDTGVTVRSSGTKLKLTGQYSGGTLVKIATNEWYLFGDITT